MLNIFAGGSTEQELMDTLSRIAPECPDCRGKRLHFCIEKMCEGSQPFCLLCQSNQHFLHRKNELRMLFVDRSFVGLRSRETFDQAQRLSQLIAAQKKRSEQLVDSQLNLLKSYSQALHELDRLKSQLITGDHLSTLYNLVQKGVLGSLSSYRQAQDQFLRAFKQVKLDNRDWDLQRLPSIAGLLWVLEKYTDNPLNMVEPNKTISQSLQTLLSEHSHTTTVENMVRETNIERFVSDQDPPVYWHAADYSYRSRRCKVVDQQKCKGSRLIVETDTPNISCEILVKNTLKELTVTSELINVVRFPEYLQKLALAMLPVNITSVTQKLPQSLRVFRVSVVSTYWSVRTPYALKNMNELREVVIRDIGMKATEVKEMMQLGLAKRLRFILFLKDDQKSNTSVRRFEGSYLHVYPTLEPHYLAYKRKILQIQRMHRSRFLVSSKDIENLLEMTMTQAEGVFQKEESISSTQTGPTSSEAGEKQQ